MRGYSQTNWGPSRPDSELLTNEDTFTPSGFGCIMAVYNDIPSSLGEHNLIRHIM